MQGSHMRDAKAPRAAAPASLRLLEVEPAGGLKNNDGMRPKF